jgi:hypothetical protein
MNITKILHQLHGDIPRRRIYWVTSKTINKISCHRNRREAALTAARLLAENHVVVVRSGDHSSKFYPNK